MEFFDSQQGQEIFWFYFRPAQASVKPLVYCVLMWGLCPGGKWPEHEADHPSPFVADVKACLHSLIYLHGMQRDNLVYYPDSKTSIRQVRSHADTCVSFLLSVLHCGCAARDSACKEFPTTKSR